jgi:hypothetical protein
VRAISPTLAQRILDLRSSSKLAINRWILFNAFFANFRFLKSLITCSERVALESMIYPVNAESM